MSVIYHFVPENMVGDTLHPLNKLKGLMPDVYEQAASKYRGREILMQRPIPPLDCLWNDVLHCSPIHPEQVRDEFIAAGLTWYPADVFVIDTKKMGFTAENTVFFDVGDTIADTIYTPFDPEKLKTLRKIPEKTKAHYRAEDKPYGLLTFLYVTHILYRGSIPTKTLDVIHVD